MPGASGITGLGLLWCGAVWCVLLVRYGGCHKWDEYRVRCGAWCNCVVQRGVLCLVCCGAWCNGMNGVLCGGCGMQMWCCGALWWLSYFNCFFFVHWCSFGGAGRDDFIFTGFAGTINPV